MTERNEDFSPKIGVLGGIGFTILSLGVILVIISLFAYLFSGAHGLEDPYSLLIGYGSAGVVIGLVILFVQTGLEYLK